MSEPVYDPQIQDILDRIQRANRPAFWQLTAEDARAAYEKAAPILDLLPRAVHRVEDRRLRVAGGSIRLRVYWPREPDPHAPLPMLLWTHGGGFTIGSVQAYDPLCRMICTRGHCVVVSVEYRLAPEYVFPTAVEDVFAALRWCADEARGLGADAARLAIAGDSAGGTLTAAAAIHARDAGLALAGQLLVYPGTGAHQDTASHRRFADDLIISAKTIQWFFSNYLRSPADREDWRFAPLLAPSLAGVAPAWVAVAECDPLHDEGVAYAERLRREGVPTTLKTYRGMVHNFFNMGRYVEAARHAHDDFLAALQAMHAQAGTM